VKLLALSLTLIVPAAFAADTSADLQKKFVGSWKLISIEGPNQSGSGKPSGMIMYDNTGHMSVQIARAVRPTFSSSANATEKEKAAAFETYVAYYGTFTFEPKNGIVIHHLEGSIVPGQVGQDNIRYFKLIGNRLTLTIANDGRGGRLALKDTTRNITWERIPAK
jgi:Lipocalin-like domain